MKRKEDDDVSRMDSLPYVMTPADVRMVLDVSRNTVYEIFHREDFPSFRVGKQLRVSRERFLMWMEQAETAS